MEEKKKKSWADMKKAFCRWVKTKEGKCTLCILAAVIVICIIGYCLIPHDVGFMKDASKQTGFILDK